LFAAYKFELQPELIAEGRRQIRPRVACRILHRPSVYGGPLNEGGNEIELCVPSTRKSGPVYDGTLDRPRSRQSPRDVLHRQALSHVVARTEAAPPAPTCRVFRCETAYRASTLHLRRSSQSRTEPILPICCDKQEYR